MAGSGQNIDAHICTCTFTATKRRLHQPKQPRCLLHGAPSSHYILNASAHSALLLFGEVSGPAALVQPAAARRPFAASSNAGSAFFLYICIVTLDLFVIMVKLTPELVESAPVRVNALRERELCLRGACFVWRRGRRLARALPGPRARAPSFPHAPRPPPPPPPPRRPESARA